METKPTTALDRTAAIKHFEDTLTEAAQKRDPRAAIVEAPDGIGHEPTWVADERDVMLREVNRLRAEQGRGPALTGDVIRVERGACGHVDYVGKYALGCYLLVIDAK